AGFLIYVATVAVVLHQSWTRSPARTAIAAALLVYASVIASAILREGSANFWTLSIFFWFPTVVFLMAFGATYKSISLRILVDLLGCPAQALLCVAVLAGCVEAERCEKRLEVTLEDGFATRTAEGYALSAMVRRMTRAVSALQGPFAIARGG